MKIVIASGKGGTGKTTVALNLASYLSKYLNKRVNLIDSDVEGDNGNLFLKRDDFDTQEVLVTKPLWKKSDCTLCGKCQTVCNYNAIAKIKNNILIFDELCHSCNACISLCPTNSLIPRKVSIGQISQSKSSDPFSFVKGVLNVKESLAPKVISELKKYVLDDGINLFDASPGTACAATKTLLGADLAVLVTEPTPFGLHDLNLAYKLCIDLDVRPSVLINRSNNLDDKIIEKFCKEENLPIIGKIPFHKKYAHTYAKGELLIDHHKELVNIFDQIWKNVEMTINQEDHPPYEIAIISGKGGTGKTTFTASLTQLIPNCVVADTDVDASNMHLLLKPKNQEIHEFSGGAKYKIDQDKCINCGICFDACQFEAITKKSNYYEIDEKNCEGCGLCFHICPEKIVSKHNSHTGDWYKSTIVDGKMLHADLNVGEENSGKLATKVRDEAYLIAQKNRSDFIIIDGPPGTGCPVIATITGVNKVIAVTEPTLSGLHDLERVLKLTDHFKISASIVINKADLNVDVCNKIENRMRELNFEVIAKIPFDENISKALNNGQTVINYNKGPTINILKDIANKLLEERDENSNYLNWTR